MRNLLRTLYAAIRRFGVLDVTRMLHVAGGNCDLPECPKEYEIRRVPMQELAELIQTGRAPEHLGEPESVNESHRAVIVALHEGRIVSFLWLATDSVRGEDNFSRAAHLGVSVEMPDGTGFVYNAWTDPDHRGKRLIAAILKWATCNRVMGTQSLLTMVDWTNSRSIAAFEHLGMRPLGSIYRFGRGSLQLSLLPSKATTIGLRLAGDAPGFKIPC